MSTYSVTNISGGPVSFDSGAAIGTGGVETVTIITPALIRLAQRSLVSIVPAPSIATSYQVANNTNSTVYIGQTKLGVGEALFTDTLTQEMLEAFSSFSVLITPAPGSLAGGGGGGGPETDPTVIVALNNAFGVATGTLGKGTVKSFVTAPDLGTDFDLGVITPSKLNVKRMVAATVGTPGVPGLVPASLAGDQNKFLRADATWQAVGNVPALTVAANYAVGDMYRYNNDLYMTTVAHVGAATPTVGSVTRMDRYPTVQTISAVAQTATKDAGIIRATGGSAQVITLPVVSAADDGTTIALKVATTQVGGVTLAAGAGNTIDASPSTALNPGDAILMQSVGTVWEVISKPASAVSSMSGSTNLAAGTSGSTPVPAAGTQNAVLFGSGTWASLVQPYAVAVDYKIGDLFSDANGFLYRVSVAHNSAASIDLTKVNKYAKVDAVEVISAAAQTITLQNSIVLATGAAAQLLTLPVVTSAEDGLVVVIKRDPLNANLVTVQRGGANTIDSSIASFTLPTAGDAYTLEVANGQWQVIDKMLATSSTPAPVYTTAATYPITASDRTVVGNVGAAAVWTLPALSSMTDGVTLVLKRDPASTFNITVNRAGTDTIDGATSYLLTSSLHLLQLVADKVHNTWRIVAQMSTGGFTKYTITYTASGVSGAPVAISTFPVGWTVATSGNNITVASGPDTLPLITSTYANVGGTNTQVFPSTNFKIQDTGVNTLTLSNATNGSFGVANGSAMQIDMYY